MYFSIMTDVLGKMVWDVQQYAQILFVEEGHGRTEKTLCEKIYVACVGRVAGYHNIRLKALDSSSGLDTKTRTGHINALSLGNSIATDASYLKNRNDHISPHPAVYT